MSNQFTMSDVLAKIAQQTDEYTDQFTDPATNVTYTLIDFSDTLSTAYEFSEVARDARINVPQRSADNFLSNHVGVIVAFDHTTSTVNVHKFTDRDQMESAWTEIECEAQRHAARASLVTLSWEYV